MNFWECCKAIVDSPSVNGYAKAYAEAGQGLSDAEAIRVQALYILNNITHWRAPEAKQVRAALKEIGKR